ncbi:MerR family transcriptional regulator [Actinokineospora inagensis]|uniref:MerR family transcriptional regulator n=1 Tax=Actinokineospora inagensis TaxID=103730 RepID=UPI00146FB2A8|nr:MerR family transcriptional regulator [Actinokineospora inagensis]
MSVDEEPPVPSGREVPGWTAGQVATRLGITESTLRSWHRRYGLEPYAARQSGQRRYGPDDVVRLTRMCELVNTGMRPAAAAGLLNGAAPLRNTQAAVVTAARKLDTGTCADLLIQSVHRWGVLRTWERVCRPSLTAVERAQRRDPDCVDNEHALSWSMTVAMHRVHRPLREADILLACAPGEQHSLPVEALAAALAERDISARVLGAAMPTPALVRAVTSTTPRTVLLWSHRADHTHHTAATAIADMGPRLLIAGPGWQPGAATWEHPHSLATAITMLTPSPSLADLSTDLE